MEHSVLVDAGSDLYEASEQVAGTEKEKLRKHARRVSEEAQTAEPDSDVLRRHHASLEELDEAEGISSEVSELVASARQKLSEFLED